MKNLTNWVQIQIFHHISQIKCCGLFSAAAIEGEAIGSAVQGSQYTGPCEDGGGRGGGGGEPVEKEPAVPL